MIQTCCSHRVNRIDNYDVKKTLKTKALTVYLEGEKNVLMFCKANVLEAAVMQIENQC